MYYIVLILEFDFKLFDIWELDHKWRVLWPPSSSTKLVHFMCALHNVYPLFWESNIFMVKHIALESGAWKIIALAQHLDSGIYLIEYVNWMFFSGASPLALL